MFDGLTQLVHIFFFFFISYFLHVGFFFYVFSFYLIYLIIIFFFIQPCSQTHIQGYWIWYCSPTHLNLGYASLMLLLIL
jgi:hypothetical protein